MKNNLCSVDTVCWIALLNRKERFHEKRDTIYKNLRKSIISLHHQQFLMRLHMHAPTLCSNQQPYNFCSKQRYEIPIGITG